MICIAFAGFSVGVLMIIARSSCRFLMAFAWSRIVFLLFSIGCLMASQWFCYWCAMELVWCPYGIPMWVLDDS